MRRQLRNVLGLAPVNLDLYKTALSHRSVREGSDENNERLEYLGDAVLSSLVAHYLMRYPYKDEGFLTEMRSKMVNRNQLNEIALKIGLKKLPFTTGSITHKNFSRNIRQYPGSRCRGGIPGQRV